MKLTIKPQYGDTVIGFNNSGVVLKDRTQCDLIDLAIMAHQSQDPTLLKLFDALPALGELQRAKMGIIEAEITGEISDDSNESRNEKQEHGGTQNTNEETGGKKIRKVRDKKGRRK